MKNPEFLNWENTKIHNLNRIRIFITCVATLLIFVLLFWEFSHGGVLTHHVLQRKDLPGISNWWGGLLLPLVTWFLVGRIITRTEKRASHTVEDINHIREILKLFLVGISFGAILAISFTFNYKPFLDNVPYLILVLSLLVPMYYAEFVLGVLFGMTYTFGAIIPTAFVTIISLVGYLIFKYVRPQLIKVTVYVSRHL